MQNPAINFIKLLSSDPSERFNIETYTDTPKGVEKPKPDPLSRRCPDLSIPDVGNLLEELQKLNQQGAGIFIAVNEFRGQRCKKNIFRVRGIHADFDNVDDKVYAAVRSRLAPSICVRTSTSRHQHWYYLFKEGESLTAPEAEALNKVLVSLGADKAASDVSRLLRLPGFNHMKLANTNKEELPELPELHEAIDPPVVTVIETGPKYTAAELVKAFTPKKNPPTSVSMTKIKARGLSGNDLHLLKVKTKSYLKQFESKLWAGHWENYKDPLTGEEPFPSQSEADYYLLRTIARMGSASCISKEALPQFVEDIFGESALAERDKWKTRPYYRERSIAAACLDISPPTLTPVATYATSPNAVPNWDLKGDLISAQYFADLYRGKFVYVSEAKQWLRWCEHEEQWLWCKSGEETQAAKDVAVMLLLEAARMTSLKPDQVIKLVREVSGLQRENRIKSIISLARSEHDMIINMSKLDAHPKLLGVKNGIVDLKTGKLLANKPSLYITKYIDTDYIPKAQCLRFKKFLNEVFEDDPETIDAVQRLVGLTTTGITSEEYIVFCVGRGANGKSIFGNVLSHLLGPYAVTAPSSLLSARRTDDHGPRSDLAMLAGTRLVSVNELPGGMNLDETVTKQLAGREEISARYLQKEFFSFLPAFTPWVRTNHKPIVKGTDEGIWRRLVIITFGRKFSLEEQDNELESKLLKEQEGILAWMVAGAKTYLADGLIFSPKMKAELSQYRADSDLLGDFLNEKTHAGVNFEEKQASLYFTYGMWCENNGFHKGTKKTFTERLSERGFRQRKSGSNRYYTGLKLFTPP